VTNQGSQWVEALRAVAADACPATPSTSTISTTVVLFYLARWCQKTTGAAEPALAGFTAAELHETARRIGDNLASDGARVDRLVAGEPSAWDEVGRLLLASARRRRAGDAAPDYAHEAAQKIAVVLLTGTPPARAAAQLDRGPRGPANEYVFTSPFTNWVRTIVIRLVVDDQRRARRERERAEVAPARAGGRVDIAVLRDAATALPGLLRAIRSLPPKQRAVCVLSLCHCDLDPLVHDRLHELAPDLFSETALVTSDDDIADRLDTKAHNVAANRSVARRKLARRDEGASDA
jgi:hypothetical protein